jgi:hypothetical protein
MSTTLPMSLFAMQALDNSIPSPRKAANPRRCVVSEPDAQRRAAALV